MKLATTLTLLFVLFALPLGNSAMAYELETVTKEVQVPWGMVWLPNGDMLVTERAGKLLRLRDGKIAATISGLPEIHANGQGGLLDIALHPDYANNGWLYLTYSSPTGDGSGSNTGLMRAKLKDDALVETQQLYKAEPNSSRGQHYGSRIAFDNQGYVYFSVGDRGDRDENPQDITRDGGKVYRLHDDGKIPSDNPFVNNPDAKHAIYSFGHRNPQGMAKHPSSGAIWIHEHGPRGGDEVNIVKAGENYGWPILSFGINYSGTKFAEGTEREGYVSPVWYWDPSIAPSGMEFVTSDKYPEWKGRLLVGSLKFRYVVLCNVQGESISEDEIILKDIGRVRNIRQAPDGFIYVATEGNGIIRIKP